MYGMRGLHSSVLNAYFCLRFRTCQEPSEKPFDISLVSREVKSHPVQEKKAPGKKPHTAATPAPVSVVDSYQKMLSSIPEFSGFGRLFKVCIFNAVPVFSFDNYVC
jgi:hypothetical protein